MMMAAAAWCGGCLLPPPPSHPSKYYITFYTHPKINNFCIRTPHTSATRTFWCVDIKKTATNYDYNFLVTFMSLRRRRYGGIILSLYAIRFAPTPMRRHVYLACARMWRWLECDGKLQHFVHTRWNGFLSVSVTTYAHFAAQKAYNDDAHQMLFIVINT